MGVIIKLYSNKKNEIQKFLNEFYNDNIPLDNDLLWEHCFNNPIESTDIIGVFIDNNETFNINMWVSLDEGFFINVTDFNADKIIRYLFERYPY
jgi:hypothetical protein